MAYPTSSNTEAQTMTQPTGANGASEHFDVLVVGAGISGIGAAWHLQHLAHSPLPGHPRRQRPANVS